MKYYINFIYVFVMCTSQGVFFGSTLSSSTKKFVDGRLDALLNRAASYQLLVAEEMNFNVGPISIMSEKGKIITNKILQMFNIEYVDPILLQKGYDVLYECFLKNIVLLQSFFDESGEEEFIKATCDICSKVVHDAVEEEAIRIENVQKEREAASLERLKIEYESESKKDIEKKDDVIEASDDSSKSDDNGHEKNKDENEKDKKELIVSDTLEKTDQDKDESKSKHSEDKKNIDDKVIVDDKIKHLVEEKELKLHLDNDHHKEL